MGIFGAAPAGTGNPNAATGTAGTSSDQTGTFLNTAGTASQSSFGPRIIPNPFDNTLLVQSSPEQWEQIQHLLAEIDIPPRQVLIDPKIYEGKLNGELSAGVGFFLQKPRAPN